MNTDPHLNTCFFRTRYNNMAAATAYYYTLIGLHTRNRCSCHWKQIHATTLSFCSSLTDQYQPRTCFPVTTIHIIIIRFTDDKTQQYLLIATPQQYARIIVLLTPNGRIQQQRVRMHGTRKQPNTSGPPPCRTHVQSTKQTFQQHFNSHNYNTETRLNTMDGLPMTGTYIQNFQIFLPAVCDVRITQNTHTHKHTSVPSSDLKVP